jgi:hypothetical protein
MVLFLVQLLLEKFKCNKLDNVIITKKIPRQLPGDWISLAKKLFIISDFKDRSFKII